MITKFEVTFALDDGTIWKFDASNIKRDLTDGGGEPIYSATAYEQKTGRRGVVNLGSDWTVRGLIVDSSFTLRNKIADAKRYYLERYLRLEHWQWIDEGLPHAIMDYASSVPISDFTEDDWKVVEENGWTRADAEELCKED